jgi:hypothetical protein
MSSAHDNADAPAAPHHSHDLGQHPLGVALLEQVEYSATSTAPLPAVKLSGAAA